MRSLKKYLVILCFASLTTGIPLLTGCAAVQPPAPEIKTLREQEASATRFVNALFFHDMTVLQEAVELPFFLNQQALLAYPQEWTMVLERLRVGSKVSENFNILEVKHLSPAQFLALKPNIWAKLLEYEFDKYAYFKFSFRQVLSAEAQRKDPKGRRFVEGQMVVITDPQTAKIRGFIL